MSRQPDRILFPIEIVTGVNDVFVGTDDGYQTVVTLPAGTYYTYDSDPEIAGYPSLYRAIAGPLGVNEDIEWYAATPSLSTDQLNGGAVMRSEASFSIDFNHASFSMDPRWFGFPAGQSAQVTSDGNDELLSPLTILGVWDSQEHAIRWSSTPTRRVDAATEDVDRDDVYEVDWGSSRIRMMVWRYIAAAHVHAARAELADYASVGQLSVGDTHNAFEHVWGVGLGDLILVHQGAGVLDVEPADYEIVRMGDAAQRGDLGRVARGMSLGGEYYEVSLTLVRRGGRYSQ